MTNPSAKDKPSGRVIADEHATMALGLLSATLHKRAEDAGTDPDAWFPEPFEFIELWNTALLETLGDFRRVYRDEA